MPRRKPIGSFLDAAASRDPGEAVPSHTNGLTSFLDNVGKEQHGSEPQAGVTTIATTPREFLLSSDAATKPASSVCDTSSLPIATAYSRQDHSPSKTVLTVNSQPSSNKHAINMRPPKTKNRIKYTESSASAAEDLTESRATEPNPQEHQANMSMSLTVQGSNTRDPSQASTVTGHATSPTTGGQAGSGNLDATVQAPLSHPTVPPTTSSALKNTHDTHDQNCDSFKQSSTSQNQLVFAGRRSNSAHDANSSLNAAEGHTGTRSKHSEKPHLTSNPANNSSVVLNPGTQAPSKATKRVSWDLQLAASSSKQPDSGKQTIGSAVPDSITRNAGGLNALFGPANRPSNRQKARQRVREEEKRARRRNQERESAWNLANTGSLANAATSSNTESRNPQPATNAREHANPLAAHATGDWDSGHPPYASENAQVQEEQQQRRPRQPVNSNANTQVGEEQQSRRPRQPVNLNGNTRANSNQKTTAPRNSPWIKSSEIPKGDPKRHRITWDSTCSNISDESSSSGGWNIRKPDAEDGGAGLLDWTGEIGPAAIDRSEPMFRADLTRTMIGQWRDKSNLEFSALQHKGHGQSVYAGGDDQIMSNIAAVAGIVAPRYWIGDVRKDKNPKLYRDPDGELDDENGDILPWWETYQDKESSVLLTIDQPPVIGIDPEETEEYRLMREDDFGSDAAIEEWKQRKRMKRRARKERLEAKQEQARKISETYGLGNAPEVPPRIQSDLKLLLRSAADHDMIAVRDIYNRHVENSWNVADFDRATKDDMLKRMRSAKDAQLPFIVACQRGELIRARSNRHNGGLDIVTPDRVVGFAYARPWDTETGDDIYRSTVTMELYVHAEFLGKKVGSCLADKMMGLLDVNDFIERAGYDIQGDELRGVGSSRVVSNILIRFPYHPLKTDRLKWVTKWLQKRFGFEKAADLHGVAHKWEQKYVVPDEALECIHS